jgi:hypothetical protein
MRDATDEWVSPIIDAWTEKFPESNIADVMLRTAVEDDGRFANICEAATEAGDLPTVLSVDWHRVGLELLHDLDWTEYPDGPAEVDDRGWLVLKETETKDTAPK